MYPLNEYITCVIIIVIHVFVKCTFFLINVILARAVEIFLQALLSRASNYAASRSAKTLTVGHM